MVSGAMLANLAVTPTIVITEHEAELFTRLLASDRRIEELESERNRLLEEKAGMAGRIEQLERQVEELTRKTGLNSTNSSKPPSSDGLRRKPRPTSPERKRRKEQGRRPGKQKGAPGARLAPVAVPDRVEELLPSHCGKCVASLAGASPAEGTGVHAGVPRLRGGDEGDIPPVGQGAGVVRAAAARDDELPGRVAARAVPANGAAAPRRLRRRHLAGDAGGDDRQRRRAGGAGG